MSKKVKKAKAKKSKKPIKKADTFDGDSPPGDPEPPPAKGN
jgi:hypothetical protein